MSNKTPSIGVLISVNTFGGLIYGYNSGIIAVVLQKLPWFPLSSTLEGILTCSLLVGAFLGSMLGGLLADKLGRRKTAIIFSIVTLVAPPGSGLCPYLPLLFVVRLLLGVGLGVTAVVAPLYVSECSPKERRGTLGTVFQLAVTFGIFLAYTVAIPIDHFGVDRGWSYLLGLGAAPAFGLLLTTIFMPESPTWLYARELITPLMSETPKPAEEKERFRDLLSRKHRRSLNIGILLCVTQQLTGINAFIFFAVYIFGDAGASPLAATVGLGAFNFLTTFIATFLVDKLGRRPLIIGGTLVMAFSSIGLALAFEFLSQKILSILSIVLIFIFIAGFEAGDGPLFWVVINELFDNSIREKGAAVLNAVAWMCNIIVSMTFRPAQQNLGSAPPMFFFGVVGIICSILLFVFLPETKGKETGGDSDSKRVISKRGSIKKGSGSGSDDYEAALLE